MQQRRLRLGDILDDYCPRERRITNHAVVAMIEDEVKQTRCTACDADHEYKQGRTPVRRRKSASALAADVVAGGLRPRTSETALDEGLEDRDDLPVADDLPDDSEDREVAGLAADAEAPDQPDDAAPDDEEREAPRSEEEDGPVHRRLIRATLPRPEGQVPERKEPDFTVRQPGGRPFERNGQRPRHGRRPARTPGAPGSQGNQAQGQYSRSGGQRREGGQRQGGQGHSQQGQGQHGQGGNRAAGQPGQGRQRRGGQSRKRGR